MITSVGSSMANTGFDDGFGLAGTASSHVSGFGGSPLAVTTGPDGRVTLLCSAPDQPIGSRTANATLSNRGGRFIDQALPNVRVVSMPRDGGRDLASNEAVNVFEDPGVASLVARKAVADPGRIAVIGDSPGLGPTLVLFEAGPLDHGITQWRPRRVDFPALRGSEYGVALAGQSVLVIAIRVRPHVRGTAELEVRVAGAGSPGQVQVLTRVEADGVDPARRAFRGTPSHTPGRTRSTRQARRGPSTRVAPPACTRRPVVRTSSRAIRRLSTG